MHIVPSAFCLQLIPQVPHIPTPEVERQLLSCLVINQDSVLIQLIPKIIPDGYLLLCDAATGMFNSEGAWLLLSSPLGLKQIDWCILHKTKLTLRRWLAAGASA